MLLHPEQVPRHAMIQMAHHEPNPPKELYWNDKLRQRANFYHSGSLFAGYHDTFVAFYEEFLSTIDNFLQRDMFIGEDQTVLQSTCNRNPNLCVYVSFDQVEDDGYFGLRYVLHYGGNYTLWYPPALSHYKSINETF